VVQVGVISLSSQAKKQHYVPQYLLRNFATGKSKNPKVWVLDKSNATIRLASVRDVAHENDFYSFGDSDGICVELEHLMSKIDSIGARIIRQVVNDGRFVLSDEDKVWLSYVVSCQMSRTPMIRKDLDNVRNAIVRKWGPDVRFEGDHRTVGEYGPESSRFNSLMMIKKDVPEFSKILQTKAWFLSEAPLNHPFIISDNPVTKYNMIPRPGRGNMGLNSKGVELYMPLSTRYSLHIICPLLAQIVCSNHPNSNEYVLGLTDGVPVPMKAENVTFANSQQVIWAERWVFGRNRVDLEMPLDMLRTNPELMAGPGVRRKPDEM
jgi:Protein of unknown function (DUF4238)